MRIVSYDLSKVMQGTVAPFVIKDCMDAFRGLGHDVYTIDLVALGDTPEERLKNLEKMLLKIRPDFVFTYNDFCLTPGVLKRLKIPYVSWFLDRPPAPLNMKEYISPYYTLFVWDKAYVEELKKSGIERVYHLPNAANPDVFKEIKLNKEEKEKYGCDVSFVGCSFYGPYKEFKEIRNPLIKGVLEEAIKIKGKNPLLDTSRVIRNITESLPYSLNLKEKALARLEVAAMGRYRKEIIEEVSDLGLVCVYGDEGWRKLLEGERIRLICRWIDPREELPIIYNASKINLNISRSQARTGLTKRVFEVMTCGGFVLTDYRKDLDNLFEEDEVVYYRNKSELRKLTEYFLDNHSERKRIAQNGRRRILREHTFKHRMEKVIEIMEDGKGKG
jgi:spore maturation protein CgeB